MGPPIDLFQTTKTQNYSIKIFQTPKFGPKSINFSVEQSTFTHVLTSLTLVNYNRETRSLVPLFKSFPLCINFYEQYQAQPTVAIERPASAMFPLCSQHYDNVPLAGLTRHKPKNKYTHQHAKKTNNPQNNGSPCTLDTY